MKNLRFLVLFVLFSCGPENSDPVPILNGLKSGYIKDNFKGKSYVVFASEKTGFYNALLTETMAGEAIEFTLAEGEFGSNLEDIHGGRWTKTGLCLTGPNLGKQLKHMNYISGFWFSLSAFYPKTTLFGDPDEEKIDLPNENPDWTINSEIVYAASFMDGIPSINEPEFINFNAPKTDVGVTDLSPDEMVLVTVTQEGARIFPLAIMNWHEIVNFSENGTDYVLSYCPLTGTAGFWDVTATGVGGRFGVSGLLYNNNLVLYDHSTLSYWSQIKQEAIHGEYKGVMPTYLPIYEMTFEAAAEMYFEFEILSENTGSFYPYDEYPYGDHRTNHNSVGYPRSYVDDRLPAKERVVSILVSGEAKAYRFSDFE